MSNENMEIDEDTASGSAQLPPLAPRSAPHKCIHLSDDEQRAILGGSVFAGHDIGASVLAGLFSHFTSADATANQVIDLEAIVGSLEETDETFFPKRVFVRDCMKEVFNLFANDTLTKNGKRVLIGSPGVGKSVLYFICALYKAEKDDKPAVYFRKSKEEDLVSAFVLFRTLTGVRVFSCRDLEKADGIKEHIKAVANCFNLDPYKKKECVVFLDGPRHDEGKDLNAAYSYFCTSGGHPIPSNSQKEVYLWLLDGWTEQEAIDGLVAFGYSTEDVQYAYDICGGCVRDMYSFLSGNDSQRALMMSTLNALSTRVGEKEVDVVLNTTTRNNADDKGNPDRLRTMFNGKSLSVNMPNSIQIVDSKYVMRILRGRIGLGKLLEAMKLGRTIKSGTVVGVYFEEILHQWFQEYMPEQIEGVLASEGNTVEGVSQLIQKAIYWMPSVPNFPNIDAAVVLGRVLFVFQYPKRPSHGFDQETFWQGFVERVRECLGFDSVHVYVVLIDDAESTLTVNFAKQWTEASGTRASAQGFNITCTSNHVNIDTTTVESICRSAAKGFTFEQAGAS